MSEQQLDNRGTVESIRSSVLDIRFPKRLPRINTRLNAGYRVSRERASIEQGRENDNE